MIRYFVSHPTAANLVMAAFIVVGLVSLPGLLRETFPRITPKRVQVTVAYPGATPEEVESAICRRVEDAIDGVENIEETVCEARENLALATVRMTQGEDLGRFFDDIRTEIEAIDDFPDTVEKPVIKQLGRVDSVASVALTGVGDPIHLKALADEVKDRMLRWGGIPRVEVGGFSDRQIRIEIPDSTARELGLSLEDIARVVARQNVDLPVGEIVSPAGSTLLRFTAERQRLDAYRDVVVASSARGGEIRLGDVAEIRAQFEDSEVRTTLDGRRAALLEISKTPADDTLRVMAAVRAFLDDERARLPPGVELTVTGDITGILVDRLEMLLVNSAQGLALVFAAMLVFFGLRQAFWISLGLPVSFLGALAAMAALDYSINMLTMVGLLIVIGILMDDAIVIAENIATKRQQGLAPRDAAVEGALQVAPGVLASFATTVAVFGSLAFLQGDLGEILRVVPVVMLLVLVVSLVEAFLILPAHLSHGARPDRRSAANARVERALDRMRARVIGPVARAAVAHRHLTLGVALLFFLGALAVVAGGGLKFQAFPDIDGDQIEARIELAAGATVEDAEAAVAYVVDALEEVDRDLSARNADGAPLVRQVVVTYNENVDAGATGAHLATVKADLLSGERRAASNDEILAAWRAAAPPRAGMRRLHLTESALGPAGRAIELRLGHDDFATLEAASAELQDWLARYRGVYNVADDLQTGRPELHVTLRDGAGALGLDARAVAEQLRAAFHGVTADEIQVGAESYEIDLRLSGTDRDSLGDLHAFSVRRPSGERVPLGVVANLDEARGYTRIRRVDRRRAATVTGDVDTDIANADEIVGHTRAEFLPGLAARHPGLTVGAEGQNAEAARTQASMLRGLLLGLIAVYLVLSFQLRSYAEPLVVMVIIPFALIGVVAGHLVMGVDLALPSMLGMVSLAGIVVNDSILLVNFIKSEHEPGVVSVAEAAPKGAEARFRAILLTSVTTIVGVVPLLTETSLQAQVLIPLVTSIAFGLASTTLLIMFVVPAFYAVLDDFGLTSLAAERRRLQEAPDAA